MCEVTDNVTDIEVKNDGKVIYANDVIVTIASIAARDVEGVAELVGSSEFSLFGKKSASKGIKVELGTEEVCIDVYTTVRYGYRIQDVCKNLQLAIKTAIETMTGLIAREVNIYVQSVIFDKPEQPVPVVEINDVSDEPVSAEEPPADVDIDVCEPESSEDSEPAEEE